VVIALVGVIFTGIIIAVTLHTASITLEKHGDLRVIECLNWTFSTVSLYIATDQIYLISNEYLNRLSFLENICIEAGKINI
jgi:hypothetical protein